jgi:hypothetical protein
MSASALSGSAPPGHAFGRGRGSAANGVALSLKEILVTSHVQGNGTSQAALPTVYRPIRFNPKDRRTFIGGSDARIIMGDDQADLIRLWQQKRGGEPVDSFNAVFARVVCV